MKDFAGAVAVITGGGSPRGIGHATGRTLAEAGCTVVLADANESALDAAVAGLRREGHEVVGVATDVSSYPSIKELAETTFDTHGRVDVLFLNAGIGSGGSLFDDDVDGWARAIAVNFMGVVHGINAFVPRMISQGGHSHVVATGSPAGSAGVMYSSPSYAVTKQAVATVMECLYGQLKERGADIQASVLLPPLTRTNLAGEPSVMDFAAQQFLRSGIPMVLAEPEEVGRMVLEAIARDSFWIRSDHNADATVDDRFKATIDWENEIVAARARSFVDSTGPDPYLWGPTA